MKSLQGLIAIGVFLIVISCDERTKKTKETPMTAAQKHTADSLAQVKKAEEAEKARPRTAADITLSKELQFDKHTLEDTYPYRDTTRSFQWEVIKERLAYIENFQKEKHQYAVLQNHRNKNREAALVEKWVRNKYKRIADTLGTERWQSVALYEPNQRETPVIYGRDGSLVSLLTSDTIDMVKVQGISFEGVWEIPKRYLKTIGDSVIFDRIAFVDLSNQNICTVEKIGYCEWVIRSMNPATSGKNQPPYSMKTPTGMFVVQEKKSKMFYVKDGTSTIEGFAPYASRFTNGAYIHGVPVNNPNGKIIDYSYTLGTVPRSHMCVRNASSHAKFVYDWTKTYGSLVVVFE